MIERLLRLQENHFERGV